MKRNPRNSKQSGQSQANEKQGRILVLRTFYGLSEKGQFWEKEAGVSGCQVEVL
jgi:hypothetical protein